jgi:flagellin-like hook-associated protein FlgL
MTSTSPLSYRFFAQAQQDVRRITSELGDLQRQIASGTVADTLQGFGAASGRLLSAQSTRAAVDARASVLNQLQARFGVQAAALGLVSDASGELALSIREAIAANDGHGIATALSLAFSSAVSALNETWNGQPMFAGERQSGRPIKVETLQQLQAAAQPEDVFDEAARHQLVKIDAGAPVRVAAKASELSTGLFDSMSALQTLLDNSGGQLGQPLAGTTANDLLAFAAAFEAHAASFTIEEGRTGQLQKRLEHEAARLQVRSDLLAKEVGEQADADLAEVSIKLNSLMTQYEAAAKTFSELSQLSLLRYL